MPSAKTCRIIPLGGLGEVGKNMTVYEHRGEAIVVDAGMAFPRDEHLGVDLILPDYSYLVARGKPVRAVILTHGHEDHVGGLPYLLREIEVGEVWATRLTLGFVKSKLDEHGLGRTTTLREATPGEGPVNIGPFKVDFVRVAHSIPDAIAVVIETSAGRIVYTGDYKMDHTPVDGMRTDVGRLAELGNLGVDLMLGDSTNAERPGTTPSERRVGEAFRQIVPLRDGRVLVACFASNIHRIQQAIDVAIETGRSVAVIGRSMRKNVNIARNLGYLDVPDEILLKPDELSQLPPYEQMILCTGSQGEPLSALTRIAFHDHAKVQIERGDTVIISAKPIPGNELHVHDAINGLTKAGAEVLHEEIAEVHASGHACAEELRTMIALLRPKTLMPVHGEFRMQAAHARLGLEAGIPEESILLAENGAVIELTPKGASIVGEVETGVTLVDGLGVGDVADVALRDRRHMAEDGVLIVVVTLTSSNRDVVVSPEIVARGFGEQDALLDEVKREVVEIIEGLLADKISEIKLLQEHLHDGIGRLVYDRTRRRPMILPVVLAV